MCCWYQKGHWPFREEFNDPRFKLKRKMDPRRAAICACKYLRAMVSQHGPQIQSVYEAAKIHTQRSKGTAATATQYHPREGELPVIAPELTSELLHCLSTLPDPWPLAKITIDMEKPSQWVSKMCRLFFADEYASVHRGCPPHHRYQTWSQHSKSFRMSSPVFSGGGEDVTCFFFWRPGRFCAWSAMCGGSNITFFFFPPVWPMTL